MATVNTVLEKAAQLRPDAWDDATKAGWILSLENRIYREVVLRHEPHNCPLCEDAGFREIARKYPEDGDRELMAKGAYEELYLLWLFSEADLLNREYDNYNNSLAQFNALYDEFTKAYNRAHPPLRSGRIFNVL